MPEQKPKFVIFTELRSDPAFIDIENFALRKIKEQKDKALAMPEGTVEQEHLAKAERQKAAHWDELWNSIKLYMFNTIGQKSKPSHKPKQFQLRRQNAI